jgi:CRISPR/Cas system-associated protein Cas7 (RAMP superfamily)
MDNKSFLDNINRLIEGYMEQDKKAGHKYELPHQVQCDIAINQEGMEEGSFRKLLETVGEKTPPTANKTFFNQLFG